MAEADPLMTGLAVWGAALSTVLGGVQLVDAVRKGPRLNSSYNLSTGEDGSFFVLENPSPTPVMITYWELYWARRTALGVKTSEPEAFPDEGYCNITVAPHGRHTLHVGDIRWGAQHADKGQLWLKLHLSGGRARWLKVYDPTKLTAAA